MLSEPGFLKQCYRKMKLIRDFEDRLHKLCSTGAVPGFTHLYAGEEASAVGIVSQLTKEDGVFSTHRAHGQILAKGAEPAAVLKEIFGRQGGLCGGKGGTMHVQDVTVGHMASNGIVGAGVPHALGNSLAAQYRGTDSVSISFLGDGASNQGGFLESLNLAKVWNLPVIFVVEDNGYAEATSSSWSVGGSQVGRAGGFGLPAEKVDKGEDFFAVYEAAKKAIDRARTGGGPSLLHLDVPIYYGHFEGDAELYRTKEELKAIRAERDCLKIMSERLVADKVCSAEDIEAIHAGVVEELDAVFDEARKAPKPAPESLMTNVYA